MSIPETPTPTPGTEPRRPIILKPATKVKALGDIMEMLELWGRPALLDLSQQLIYTKLTHSEDEELLAAHQSFVSKTNQLVQEYNQAAEDDSMNKNENPEGGTENGEPKQ